MCSGKDTDAGCTHDNSAAETGTVLLTDCNARLSPVLERQFRYSYLPISSLQSGAGTTNDGCGVEDENAASAAGGTPLAISLRALDSNPELYP